MGLDKAMIVAGIGCRKGASTGAVVAAVHAAVSRSGIGIAALDALATLALKKDEAGILGAGRALSLDVIAVDETQASGAASRALTSSQRSLEATGTRSASETAALAAAGADSRLLAPRLVLGDVTCALAASGDAP